jgi:hypothetical protein
MLTKTKLALAALLVLGAGSLAQAASDNDGGNESGGYVLPGNTDGVNPVYHPGWFPRYGHVARAYDRANRFTYSGGGASYAYVPPVIHRKHTAR